MDTLDPWSGAHVPAPSSVPHECETKILDTNTRTEMKLRKLLIVSPAAFILFALPVRAQQSGDQAGTTRTFVAPGAASEAPQYGFSITMQPSPHLEYTYPVVGAVTHGSNAERAGLVHGDTILSVNGRAARRPPLFANPAVGTRYLLRIRRGGEEMEIEFVYPAPPLPAVSAQP